MEGIPTGPIGSDCLLGKSDMTNMAGTLPNPLPNREGMGRGAQRRFLKTGEGWVWEERGHEGL